ncbi:IclR family transcriptional regulator [Corynebacterium canis]|uniref:IclR family transcriptional regulator n=1 Tax=Corynebacterium canis TaxID=679663 RepID=A0A5C5TX79_9CORY|nr:IclR family transcriptional regulator [Corynebacterium canis]TWT18237.1 IclR family transcriptional regulator [Corynebacterium canis]WJY75085.1 Acetate operon repressor [Corynebacterium canis]
MGQYQPPGNGSGIKVLDRAVHILTTIAEQPRSLSELCEATGLPRATTHRLATALESHRLLTRTSDGRWNIGSALTALGSGSSDKLVDAATPLMAAIMEHTNESVQLYRLTGTTRTCIASLEPPSGLQNTVPVGSRMPLTAGSAARVFMAYASPQLRAAIMPKAAFSIEDLEQVRAANFAESTSEREAGLASVSTPVFDHTGQVIAALSISGPIERFGPHPGTRWAPALIDAAEKLSAQL